MRTLSLVVGFLLLAPEALATGAAVSTASPSGTATVPLDQLIPLYTQRQAYVPPPPTEALVKSQLKGRLSTDALQVDANFQVEVLADGRWTQVRLLQLDADTYPTALPTLEDATVGVVDGFLCLLTRKAGRHDFDVGLTVRASGTGPERRVQLRFGPEASPVPLELDADTSIFTLMEPLPTSGEGYAVYPVQGVVRVGWRSASSVSQSTKPQVRPPMEPRIAEATATWVSTLEGRASLRVSYTLNLDREQPLELTVPEGHKLERVTLNAVPIPVEEAKDGVLKLKVAPSRLGETSGALEVVLARELGVFHLSGRLKLALPRVSWPVAELRARAHFPAVFNYRREGGSLEQVDAADAVAVTASAPLPGKVLHFRQYLVAASSPTLELGYSVDISDSYFR